MIKTIKKQDYDKLKLTPISVNLEDVPQDTKAHMVNSAGVYPLVYLNTQIIRYGDIESFVLNGEDFYPTLKLTFKDTNGIFMTNAFVFDDYTVSIFLKSENENLKSIRLDFKITKFNKADNTKSVKENEIPINSYHLEGVINVNYLYICQQTSYKGLTSFEIIKRMADESGLGMASNVSNTSDRMTWLNPNKENYKFANWITERSYLNENSYFHCLIDFHYNFYFVDIEREFREDINKYKQILNSLYKQKYDFPNLDEKSEDVDIPVLTNDSSMENTSGYFDTYKMINQSSSISVKDGYLRKIMYYDTSGNWNERAGYNHEYVLDSNITPDSEETSVILKGKPGERDFYENHIRAYYGGFHDPDNVHENYDFSTILNATNKTDMKKLGVRLELLKLNFNLYRFQKVIVYIRTSVGMVDGYPSQYLSGIWLITSISFKFKDGMLKQILTLVKREIEPMT